MGDYTASEFLTLLERAGIQVQKYDPKTDKVQLPTGKVSLDKFRELIVMGLGPEIGSWPIAEILWEADLKALRKLLQSSKRRSGAVPPGFENLTLNVDITSEDKPFFLTDKNEVKSSITGSVYLRAMQIPPELAYQQARYVNPQYMPRIGPGVHREVGDYPEDVYNTYRPPIWKDHPDWDQLPDKLPTTFKKLVEHLLPVEYERKYLYSWIWHSLFDRSYIYLVLCGAPATGKNRLKNVLRALHGHWNTADGKESTFKEKFNSQLQNATLMWCDELRYTYKMENRMKEIQNDSLSIERKGIDATMRTRLYASILISNNMPRDNYIAHDARKYAPLMITDVRLDQVMKPEEIDELTVKTQDETHPGFDPRYIAQIAKWIEKHGYDEDLARKQLEYKGQKFYELAFTSMSDWQKTALVAIAEGVGGNKVRHEDDLGYLWSTAERAIFKGKQSRYSPPEFSTAKHFFKVFRDFGGNNCFKLTPIKGSLTGDFWIKITKTIETEKDADGTAEVVSSGVPDAAREEKTGSTKESGGGNGAETAGKPKKARARAQGNRDRVPNAGLEDASELDYF